MGNYITQTGLTGGDLAVPADTLLDLVDDEAVGTLTSDGQTRIDQAIDDAEAEVDGYCATLYTVPFTVVPSLVPALSKKIAEYRLYARKDRIPLAVEKDYDNAISTLKMLAQGKIKLGADAPEPAPTVGTDLATIGGNDRAFTRDKLRGF